MKSIILTLVAVLLNISTISWGAEGRSYERPKDETIQQQVPQMPDGRGPRKGMGPPPEAMAACKDKSEGESCSFTSPHGQVDGTCRRPPQQADLACVPNDHKPQHMNRDKTRG